MDLDSMLGKVHHNPKFIIHENKSSETETELEEQIKLFDNITNSKDVNYTLQKTADEVIEDLDTQEFDPLSPSIGERLTRTDVENQRLIKLQTRLTKKFG